MALRDGPGSLFERLASFENLYQAARQARRGKRFKAATARFHHALAARLVELRDELLSGAYRPGAYHSFTIFEPSRRFREPWASDHSILAFLASWRAIYWLSMTENAVAKQIVDVAYRVHTSLGPGLFESVQEAVLASELEKRGLHIVRQQPIPVVYEGTRFEMGFRADLVVEDKVIVEIKSIAELTALHRKQLLTYLRLADKRLGLLINFNVAMIKDGITRIVNGLEE